MLCGREAWFYLLCDRLHLYNIGYMLTLMEPKVKARQRAWRNVRHSTTNQISETE